MPTVNPNYDGPTCEECYKYVYNDTFNTKLRCNHNICINCAPTKRCPICKNGTLCDCLAMLCIL